MHGLHKQLLNSSMRGKLIVILDRRVKELRYGETFLLLDLLRKTPNQGDLNIIFLMYLFRGLAS